MSLDVSTEWKNLGDLLDLTMGKMKVPRVLEMGIQMVPYLETMMVQK